MNIFTQVIVLFSIVGVGFLCKKLKVISNQMNLDVGNLLVYVSMPAMIITSLSSFEYSPKMMSNSGKILIISFSMYCLFIILSYILPRIVAVKDKVFDLFQFVIVFGNTGFLGFPVAYSIFGKEGLFYMAVCDICYSIFVWTFGVMVLSRHKSGGKTSMKQSMLTMVKQCSNPNIIAIIIGFIVFAASVKLPAIIAMPLSLLSSLTTPLAMIFIGSMLSDIPFMEIICDWKVIFICSQRLLLLPVIVFSLLTLLGRQGFILSVPVLYAAMPAASSTPIMAQKYGNDGHLASKLVFVSTMLSMLTIPLVASFIS